MDLEKLLADLFEGRWPENRNGYEINTALKFKPWVLPADSIWSEYKAGRPQRNVWDERALEVLRQLHDDYRVRAEV